MKTAGLPTTEPTIRFSATVGAGMILPEAIREKLPKVEKLTLEGTANGFPFRASLTSQGELQLSRALREAIGGKPGQEIDVEITRIGDEPEVRLPEDLRHALERTPEAKSLWMEITPMARREWVRWIASAKQAQTRQKRIEVGLDKLTKGMRRPCCFPGLNFVTKGLVLPEETWGPLPDTKKER